MKCPYCSGTGYPHPHLWAQGHAVTCICAVGMREQDKHPRWANVEALRKAALVKKLGAGVGK